LKSEETSSLKWVDSSSNRTIQKRANKIWEEEVNQAKMLAIFHKIGKGYRRLVILNELLRALLI